MTKDLIKNLPCSFPGKLGTLSTVEVRTAAHAQGTLDCDPYRTDK